MNPFFSIIIPTYNRAHLLKKAVDSVLAQTFPDWELVIVDDGSTDNTREVVQSYNDKRIKYVYQKNAERSAARNNGIKNSSGTYICFLDSDDYYLSQRLELLYAELKKQSFPVACFYTGLMLDENGLLIERNEPIIDRNVFDRIAVSVIHSQQMCIHYTILNEFNYDPQFHIGEDMELWLRIAGKFPFEYLKNQFTVAVVNHDDRSVNVKRYNSYPNRLQMLKRVFANDHSGKNISQSIKSQLISTCYFGIAKYFIYKGEKSKAVKNLLLAIITDLSNYQNKYRVNLILNLLLPKGIEKAVLLLE